MNKNLKQRWEEYVASELAHVTPVLTELGYMLDESQQHIIGERYLLMDTHDVGGSGLKLVLTGVNKATGQRVIIKATSDSGGKREIENECKARQTITALPFSYSIFKAPTEFHHREHRGVLVSITELIEQEIPFLERSIAEQFSLSLKALKTQEGAHATTYSHMRAVQSAFTTTTPKQYLRNAQTYCEEISATAPDIQEICKQALFQIEAQAIYIQQYCGFLTHADFVPHNLRIRGGEIYLLDYASIHFGNKHESWARFLNFMMLYNPGLETQLLQYMKDNRSDEENQSLRAMRMYKMLFLLHFYSGSLVSATGQQLKLTEERVRFWTEALRSILIGARLNTETIASYKNARDSLRSEEERKRQQNLH